MSSWSGGYLLHGDVLPEEAGGFRLPDRDVAIEPQLTVRMWRVLNEHATGSLAGGWRTIAPCLTSWRSLKFNRLNVNIWPHGPLP